LDVLFFGRCPIAFPGPIQTDPSISFLSGFGSFPFSFFCSDWISHLYRVFASVICFLSSPFLSHEFFGQLFLFFVVFFIPFVFPYGPDVPVFLTALISKGMNVLPLVTAPHFLRAI